MNRSLNGQFSPSKRIAGFGALAALIFSAACTTAPELPPPAAHLVQTDAPASALAASIPPPTAQTLLLPPPRTSEKTETYSVVVNNVAVHDLLFALARDARINVDIHPGIEGRVTLNAVNQTLPQILDRLARQIDLRWELQGPNLAVMPDTPYLKNYRIDYVNMARETTGSVAVTTQINSSIPGVAAESTNGNNSITKIDNSAKNKFWETLVQNIKDLLHETDKILPEGSSETVVEQAFAQTPGAAGTINETTGGSKKAAAPPLPANASGSTMVRRVTYREAAAVIAHPESGTIAVRATSRQHEKIREFIDLVMRSARRQVLIEATVAEVELNTQYEQGIDWGMVRNSAVANGVDLVQSGSALAGPGLLTLTGRGASGSGVFSTSLRLLETFGNVKVLSSPKISVLNNQPAVLKVVDNVVYFLVKGETTTANNTAVVTYTSTAYSVPIGFVMNVTPQVSEDDTITLNLRPSISRVVGQGTLDPNPDLARLNIENRIPVIRTREMESLLRLENGNIAILGGLMEDARVNEDAAVPWFHKVPVLGALFTQKSAAKRKTELVVFLRPTIIRSDALGSDLSRIREHLPGERFFANEPSAPYQLLPGGDTPMTHNGKGER